MFQVRGKSAVQRKITTNRGGLLFLSHGFLTGYIIFAVKCVSCVHGLSHLRSLLKFADRSIESTHWPVSKACVSSCCKLFHSLSYDYT